MKKLIISTSNLGYDISIYELFTDCPIEMLKEIDTKYGMQTRSESTTIEQIIHGLIDSSFKVRIMKVICINTTYIPNMNIDYKARSGNY